MGKRRGRELRYIEIAQRLDARPDKKSELIARQLTHDIITRQLQPGDNLDSEQAMIERFDVSRESLREALRLLEVAGLLKIRRGPGGGAFVGTVDPANLGRFASLFFHMAGATYGELFDAYAMTDALLAEQAAGNPDNERRRSAMAPYLVHHDDDADLQHFIDRHAGFHAAVGELAGNRVIQITMGAVSLLVARHYVSLAERQRLTLEGAVTGRPFVERDHLAIAAAIAAGRPRAARRLMAAHVQSIIDVMVGDGLDRADVIEWA